VTGIEASAPGKAVISGEYAVLHGGTAIAFAVSRRARVSVRANGADLVTVAAPGYLQQPIRGQVRADGTLAWIDALPGPDTLRLVECVWIHAAGASLRGIDIDLDTRDFVDPSSGQKLGLGSSAALAVALSGALAAALPQPAGVCTAADRAHRDFQRGRGSGVDIAASCTGGVIAFRRGLAVRCSRLMPGLAWRLLWSGRPASTAVKLAQSDAISGPVADALVASSDAAAEAWESGDADAALAALRVFTERLDRYGVDGQLGIFEAGHRELADLARSRDELLYKPCGAGGGDIGIVFGRADANVDAFVDDAARFGFTPLDIGVDDDGLRVTGALR